MATSTTDLTLSFDPKDIYKDEIRWRKFGFSYNRPHRFILPQWHIRLWKYILWRVAWAVWHVCWLAKSIQLDHQIFGNLKKWPIYFTNISYILLTLQSATHALIVIYHWYIGKTHNHHFHGEGSPWYMHILWLTCSVAFNSAIVVSAAYWILIFDGTLHYAISVMTHGMNSVYVLSDIAITAIPVRILHVIYSMVYITLYILFTYFFQSHRDSSLSMDTADTVIYTFLNWNKPRNAAGVATGAVLGLFPFVHILQFFIYKVRIYVHYRIRHAAGAGDQDYEHEHSE